MSSTKGTIPANISSLIRQVRINSGEYLFPIFETVVNSIQSIAESTREDGDIVVKVFRVLQATTDNTLSEKSEVVGFEVRDNGVGFNDDHFQSFKEAYTEKKVDLGCKGIGRFVALAVFAKIEVESTYKDSKGKYRCRNFVFNEREAVQELTNEEVETATDTSTTIKLTAIREKFNISESAEAIAEELLRHTLIYFLTSNAPTISVIDTNTNKVIDLSDVFAQNISVDEALEEVEIKGQKFQLFFLKTYFKDYHKHLIHYCGHNREVKKVPLADLIVDLSNRRIQEGDKSYFISAYVTGDYLDQHVDDFRNRFTFPTKTSESLFNTISLDDLNESVSGSIAERLMPVLEEFAQEKLESIKTFIFTEGMEYAHLLKHEEVLATIKPGLQNADLETALHRANYELARQQKAKVNEFLSKRPDQIESTDEFKTFLTELMQSQSEQGKSSLVRYMMHRKAVLKVFDKFIQIQQSQGYKYEGDIHDIIFERKTTDAQISFNDHNLWIVDERLAYSNYLSSDLPVGDNTKPDVFAYDKKFIYGDPQEYIVLLEFKRPGRTNYTIAEKNVGNQIFLQAQDMINSGGGKTATGRNLNVTEDTPKFGFVIADMDNELIKTMRQHGYRITPKGTLFKYEEGINLFIEVMSYDQLLKDANLRHLAFFRQLGIDTI